MCSFVHVYDIKKVCQILWRSSKNFNLTCDSCTPGCAKSSRPCLPINYILVIVLIPNFVIPRRPIEVWNRRKEVDSLELWNMTNTQKTRHVTPNIKKKGKRIKDDITCKYMYHIGWVSEWVISKFNGTSTPKGSYSAKTGVNYPIWV